MTQQEIAERFDAELAKNLRAERQLVENWRAEQEAKAKRLREQHRAVEAPRALL